MHEQIHVYIHTSYALEHSSVRIVYPCSLPAVHTVPQNSHAVDTTQSLSGSHLCWHDNQLSPQMINRSLLH